MKIKIADEDVTEEIRRTKRARVKSDFEYNPKRNMYTTNSPLVIANF
jgi:hypothetical protein